MAKLRVYELAKELKLTTQEIMRVLSHLNIQVKTHMSALEDSEIQRIRQHMADLQKPMPKPKEAAPAPKGPGFPQQASAVPPRGKEGHRQPTPVVPHQGRPAVAAPPAAQQRNNQRANDLHGREGFRGREPHGQGLRLTNPGEGTATQGYPQGGNRPATPAGTNRPFQPHGGPRPVNRPAPRSPGDGGRGAVPQPGHFGGARHGTPTHRPPGVPQTPGPHRQTGPGGKGGGVAAGKGPQSTVTKPGKGQKGEMKSGKDRFGQRDNGWDNEGLGYGRPKKNRPDEAKIFGRNRKGKGVQAPPPRQEGPTVRKVTIGDTVVVQELAKEMGRTAAEVIRKLINLGVMVSLNQEIDADVATIVAAEFGVEVEVKSERAKMEVADIEDSPESLQSRPPVVTVMGHVDHGKTSLLDAIRQTNVTATEAGGITQHIGAYQVMVKGRNITFLDTPGHEAFTSMRARGAQATDIAILVVAADDGVMPQTVEALNHAKAAGVPIIVAINKMDKAEANPDRVKQQLTEYGLVSEEWGGDTIFVPVSAIKRQGLDHLLEMVLLVADMAELKANPDRAAKGVVIEAELDKGRGPVATVLVQKGTLRVGDSLVVGHTHGKVRAMMDFRGQRIKEAGPSVPVQVLGLVDVPVAGEIFQVAEDDRLARDVADRRQIVKREEDLRKGNRVNLEDIFKRMDAGEIKDLNIILKADVQGSVEALRQALERLSTDEVRVNIIHSGVGAITETDVMLAAASNAIIIGFNVRPDANSRKASEQEQVDIRLYRIIYEAIEDVQAAMSGLLEPEIREVSLGRAEVRQVFRVSKVGTIAGCYVTDGKITNTSKIRVIRDGVTVYEGRLASLRRFKDDVREVSQGYECGIGLEKFNDIKENDILEAYTLESIKRQI